MTERLREVALKSSQGYLSKLDLGLQCYVCGSA